MLLASNLWTSYFTIEFNDKNWQEHVNQNDKDWKSHIEEVSGPLYREAGLIEGYYWANYDQCVKFFIDDFCMRKAILQYRNGQHKQLTPWNYQRVKGYEYY